MKQKVRKGIRNLSLITAIEKELFSDLFFPTDVTKQSIGSGDKILIVGGELFNKGAQAMTFTVVDQMSRRYPKKDIVLLSGRDYHRPAEEKSRYNFEILPWGPEVQLSLFSNVEEINTTEYPSADVDRVQDVVSNSSFVIDINGYAFSSQLGFRSSLTYLANIIIAKKYDLSMYILPQSIGPFDYPLGKKIFLNPFMRTYLSYPEVICPREKDGVKALSPYTRINVEREFDIVLQNEGYNLNNIFNGDPDCERKEIEADAVGIVPNSKVFERTNPEELYSLYESAITELLNSGRTVYVFRHSTEDLDHCRAIKHRFKNEDDVVLFEQEWNAIELEHIISQFDFMIASRYHSIIHAYKNEVPVIAIGWAVKYQELLEEFEQDNLFFDGRNDISRSAFISKIAYLDKECEKESERIKSKLSKIQQENIFDKYLEIS